jgi:hypothetical protein
VTDVYPNMQNLAALAFSPQITMHHCVSGHAPSDGIRVCNFPRFPIDF